MSAFFRIFAIFIDWPLLALLPAAVLFAVARLRDSRLALVAAACWAIYAAYELGMHARLLCSGECNIRVDLLLIYPGLFLLSVLALVLALTRRSARNS